MAFETCRLKAKKKKQKNQKTELPWPRWEGMLQQFIHVQKKAAGFSFHFPHSSGEFLLCNQAPWRCNEEVIGILSIFFILGLWVISRSWGIWKEVKQSMAIGFILGQSDGRIIKTYSKDLKIHPARPSMTHGFMLPNWCDKTSGHTALKITRKIQVCDWFGQIDWTYGNWKNCGFPVANLPQVR